MNFEGDVACLGAVFNRRMGVLVNSMEFPILDLTFDHDKPLRLRMTCDDWNDLPPSVELLDASGQPYGSSVMLGGIFHSGPHPRVGRPFVCMRGTREYHTHDNHLGETWDQYRGQEGMDLVGIALQIGSNWRKVVR